MDYPFAPKSLAHAENRTDLCTFSSFKDLYGFMRLRSTLGKEPISETDYVSVGALGILNIDQPYDIRARNAIFPNKPYGGMVFNLVEVEITNQD